MLVCCSDNDEFTLECSASDISIKNITFEQEGNDNEGMVIIKDGRVTVDNCEMRCVTNGITVESTGELVMRECKLHGAKVRSISFTSFFMYSSQVE